MRKINGIISGDYLNNSIQACTLSDAAQQLAVKKLFCKFDCSQVYHCLQLADQKSNKLSAFNFASRTFAYKKLAQVVNRSLSAFSSFMSEYPDRVIKPGQCAQFVDDVGITAGTAMLLIRNIPAVFECIRRAGLKLTIKKPLWSY